MQIYKAILAGFWQSGSLFLVLTFVCLVVSMDCSDEFKVVFDRLFNFLLIILSTMLIWMILIALEQSFSALPQQFLSFCTRTFSDFSSDFSKLHFVLSDFNFSHSEVCCWYKSGC